MVIFDGTGSHISENVAMGRAAWTETCDAHPDGSGYDLTSHKEASGDLEWTIEFRE